MSMENRVLKRCPKCTKSMEETANFYSYKDKENKGTHVHCKKCFTMHVNLREPSTVLPLLEELDFPYIAAEWTSLVDKYGNNPKTSSTAVFGRYIGKMKLTQYKKYSFADTAKFMEEEKLRVMQDQAAKLNQINKYRQAVADGELENIGVSSDMVAAGETFVGGYDDSLLSDEEIANLACPTVDVDTVSGMDFFNETTNGLTVEDKFYLFGKWGKTYTIPECIILEKLYLEMMDSYDIRTGSHKDYLLKICRVSLKIDQALECNDIEGYQKMARVYDVLMKSAKFTAAQIKDQADDYTDSVGSLVATCEEKGFIPHYHEERQDVVDVTLNDMNNYTRNLIMNEMNLGNLIEIHLTKMQAEQDKDEDEMTDDEDDLLMVGLEDETDILKDEDYEDFNEMLEAEEVYDENLLKRSSDF